LILRSILLKSTGFGGLPTPLTAVKIFIKSLLAIDLRSLGGLEWGWRTSAATDQGTLSRIGGFVSVMGVQGVCDDSRGHSPNDVSQVDDNGLGTHRHYGARSTRISSRVERRALRWVLFPPSVLNFDATQCCSNLKCLAASAITVFPERPLEHPR